MPTAERTLYTAPGEYSTDDIDLPSLAVQQQSPQEPEQVRNVDFEDALRRVDELLPSDMEARWLLHAFESSGAEKLREIGLRARDYRKYFEAWETLHLVQGGPEETFIRSDMAHYIRHYFSTGLAKLAAAEVELMVRTYEKYKSFMCKFEKLVAGWTAPYFADHMTLHLNLKHGGRGIVVTAGNKQASHLRTLVDSLRGVGCTLPIEVMYLDNADLNVEVQEELSALDGVTTREMAPMVDDRDWKLTGWAAKPYAILFSSFREAIFIDADSLFFHDPEMLFEDQDYQRTGALFFKDRALWREWKKDWLKKVLPKPVSAQVLDSRYWKGESGQMQESGVVVIDKWRHFISMLIVCRLNGPEREGDKAKGTSGVYDMVYGDKETFWIGWELAGDTDYAFHRGRVGVMGIDEEEKNKKASNKNEAATEELKRSANANATAEADKSARKEITICSPQLLHLGVDGQPLWFNGGLVQNKFAPMKEWEFETFREFIVEPEVSSTSSWTMLTGNRACLTGGDGLRFPFSRNDSESLDMMKNHAKKYLKNPAGVE
ncbi:putative alpha-1,3-mannosyltransferase MNN14 [Beauveria bassiana]|uniref:Putative alpha-1,3-mannosyltransferase MNN14 n=1 Tax=Beauveria bassiana TaxID=176275 RepID=A0A2N6NNT5_BEABA|nr:putative alpha-1,3-mannosyltransferase MNN14 [Beauveria bassiana]